MKAVLVIDMPKNCEECPCFKELINYGGVDYTYCGIDEHLIARYKSIHCPLMPLEENYISIDWLKQNIPFQNEEDRNILLSMLDVWRNKNE